MRSTIRRYVPLTAAVLAVAVLAGCAPAGDAPAQDQAAYVLGSVLSACDQYGNRVYVQRSTTKALAVVGQDPTCTAVSG